MTRSNGERNFEQAQDALGRADRSAGRAREKGWRGVRGYLLVWAIASVGLVLGLGFGSTAFAIGIFVAWAILSLVGGLWSRSRGLIPRGGGARIGRAAGLWAACYAIALAVGVGLHAPSVGFWIVAAVFTAVPLVVAALIPAPPAAHVS